jgi:hypothetical protein
MKEKEMQTESNTNHRPTFARFPLGQTFITPGAEEALMVAGQTGIEFLRRHVSGDFGELTDEDTQENELSLREGFRVLTACGSSPKPTAARRQFFSRQNIDPTATRRECFRPRAAKYVSFASMPSWLPLTTTPSFSK